MQNKTASILLLTGSLSGLLSLMIMIFFRGDAEVRPQSFDMITYIYMLQEIATCAAIIVFAINYFKNGLEGMKIAGTLFIIAGICSVAYFTILQYEYGRLNYSLQVREKINFLLWLITAVAHIFLGIQLIRNNAFRKFTAWMLFIVGALIISQATQGILRQFAVLLIDNQYISKDLSGLKAVLFFLTLCTPVGFLLIAERTEFLRFRNKSTEEIASEFETGERTDSHDLLDLAMTKEKVIETHRKEDHNSVLWWMLTFIIASIPVIGFGFTIYWSVAKSQVRRGNWAVTSILVTMVSILFYVLYFLNEIELPVKASNLGFFIIGVIVFFGVVIAICASYNNRNQENISLENYTYAPTVSGWISYSLLMGVPLVNIICLIVFASDSRDKYRQTWAQGRLLLIPFSLIAILQYSFIVSLFGRF